MFNQYYYNIFFYHNKPILGKFSTKNFKNLNKKSDLLLSYTPGVALISNMIYRDYFYSYLCTSKNNLIAVITNGTAVLGLGSLGSLPSKTVMEGKSALFKKFSDINSYDIEVSQYNSFLFIKIILSLENSFGGINLEDIKSPNCFYIENYLINKIKIPVFHDDQHGTSIIASSYIINSLKNKNKNIFDSKIVCLGAGAASISCVNLFLELGFLKKNIFIFDSKGGVFFFRDNLNLLKKRFAIYSNSFFLNNFKINFDILLCCSVSNSLDFKLLNIMNPDPIILTLSNPDPELLPEISKFVRNDLLLSTGRSDYYNQVNNLICYPYLFRGVLDSILIKIIDLIKIKCVFVISDLVLNNFLEYHYFIENFFLKKFSKNFLIPSPFDFRLIVRIPFIVFKYSVKFSVNNFYIKNFYFYLKKLSFINLR